MNVKLVMGVRIKICSILALGFGLIQGVMAQVPAISGLSQTSGPVNQRILINGNGFSDTPANLRVLFGGAAGQVISSSSSSIEVEVPAGVTTGAVQVVNLQNNLSGFSPKPFYLSFSGSGFDPAQLGTEIQNSNSREYFDLCLCDFNNDGKLDIANTQVENATDVIIYKNNSTPGNISLQRLTQSNNPELGVNSVTSNLTCGDVNGDGLNDLVVTKSGNPRNVIYVFRNMTSSGNIKFDNPISLFIGTEEIAKRVMIRDLDADGRPEIIVTNTFNNHIQVFKNNSAAGDVFFESTPYTLEVTGAASTNALVVEDLNNDGLPDIATNPFVARDLYFIVNRSSVGNISFYPAQALSVEGNLNNMAAGDFNQDGKIDLVVTKTIQNEISVFVNNTTEASEQISVQEVTYPTDDGPWGVNTADIDGDSRLDILVANRDNGVISFFRNDGGTGINLTTYSIPTSLFTRNIKGGDIDGDGKPDLVYTSFNNANSDFALSVIRNQHCVVPEVEPLGPLTICVGATKTLTATGAINVTYDWDKDNTIIKTGTEDFLDITDPGVYKLIMTGESGSCVEISNAVIVNAGTGDAPDLPVITNTGPYCEGASINLSTDEITGASYAWTGPDGFSSADRNPSISNATAANAGQYELVVTVGDCSSNPATTLVYVVELPDFQVTADGSTEICSGNNLTLNVGNISGYTYQWQRDGQPVSGATGSSYNAGQAGSYTVIVTQSSSSCQVETSNAVDVTLIDPVSAGINAPLTGCVGEELLFTNTSSWDADAEVAFTWDFGDGGQSVNTQDATRTYTQAGTYTVTLTVEYTSGACSDQNTRSITISERPVFQIQKSPNEEICQGDSLSLSVSSEFASYSWSTGETTRDINVLNSGNYSVTVTDQNGCTNEVIEIIEFLESPEVLITTELEEIEPGREFQLDVEGALSYIWRPGNVLNDSTLANPVGRIFESTLFIVTGENANGCSGKDSILVETLEGNTIFVEPRNVFSPNGDGIDDLWIIDNIETYSDCTLIIFNGNGSTVYEASPYTNDWNAVYNGRDLPEGAYFFVIRCEGKEPRTGSVTVIR